MAGDETTRIGPLGAILNMAHTMVEGRTLEITLNAIVENVGRAMFAESASLGSYYPERDEYVYEAGWREGGLTLEERANVGAAYKLSESPDIRRVIESRTLCQCHADDPALSQPDRAYLEKWGLKTTLDGRLVYGGKVIGLLGIEESRFVRRYTPSELDLFSQLCDLASVGVFAARQARELEEAHKEISSLRRQLGQPAH